MQFGVVNKSTILNRFVLHTLQRKIPHAAVITRKTNIKLGILNGGWGERTVKEPNFFIITVFIKKECQNFSISSVTIINRVAEKVVIGKF